GLAGLQLPDSVGRAGELPAGDCQGGGKGQRGGACRRAAMRAKPAHDSPPGLELRCETPREFLGRLQAIGRVECQAAPDDGVEGRIDTPQIRSKTRRPPLLLFEQRLDKSPWVARTRRTLEWDSPVAEFEQGGPEAENVGTRADMLFFPVCGRQKAA